jgi:membrane-associated phospholipid phosphatase
MKIITSIILTAVLIGNSATFAQADSLSRQRINAPALIIPAALVTYGVIAHTVPPIRKVDRAIDDKMADLNLHTTVDDYLQYAPAAAVYALDFIGIKAKHNFRDRTFIVASSYLMTGATVTAVKYLTNIPRPTGTANNSFPSGHTATAFTGAHILFREYRDISPWIGVAGYVSAAAVGSMRMINRRHWLGDVAAGAGVGILSVEMAYFLLPVFHSVVGIPKNVAVVPTVGGGSYGIGMACVF